MEPGNRSTIVLTGLSLLFLGLNWLFLSDSWGRHRPSPSIPPLDPSFTNTTTVRLSTAELRRRGEDTSGVECYSCHEKNKVPVLHIGTNGIINLPKEHNDLVMRHGRNNRNDVCFNCHNPTNLEALITRDGRTLAIDQSSVLCGSCHGPTYRDWEIGVHGRMNGHWDRNLGPFSRQDCVSCHDPHNPAFPSIKPAPAPNGRGNPDHAEKSGGLTQTSNQTTPVHHE